MGSLKYSKLPVLGLLIRGGFWELPMLVARLRTPRKGLPGKVKKRLLVVKLDAIGDFLLFLDALQKIRKVYAPQEWEITLLGNRLWKDLAVALEVADQYRFIHLRDFEINPLTRLKTLSWVRAKDFDVVLQGVFSRSFYRDDVFARVSEAPKRVAYRGDAHNSPQAWLDRGNHFYTDLVEPAKPGSSHTLETHSQLTAFLGEKSGVSLPVLPTLKVSVRSTLPAMHDPYFVMVPGAGLRLKQWPVERFAALAQAVHGRTGFRPVLLGGIGDRRLTEQMTLSVPSLPWLDLSGRTSLTEALTIITKARFYLGNDTGLTHMATMARIRTLVIVGGAFPGRDFPYPKGVAPHLITVSNLPHCKGCGSHCSSLIDGVASCIHDISLEAVMASIPWL